MPPEDRILTVPNVISLVRLACIPWFVWLLFGSEPPDRYGAALLLAALGCTDWIDGYIARRYQQVSTLGKVLDPTADRIMLLVGVGGIMIDGSAPVWVAVAVLVREALVSIAVVVLAAMGARRIDVQWAGKAGTFACMVAFPLFLTSHSTAGWADLAGTLAWLVVLPGLVLAWYAALMYIPMARTALAEGRVGSTP
ncbi:MAG TPA: CDP-alcohol phosphatidyltransferase family protein [Acidimicrobiales bacterium]|nr:CDP-alcohol phosphatidyltransferase family protein [Acidimicrobiales bacterium]